MKKLALNDIQNIGAGILEYIDKICKENNITYYLSSGTLLGAVRHKGFIPWDDDIDIFMPRKDYMKFIECTKSNNGRYKTFSLYNDNDWYYPITKVIDTNTTGIEGNCKPLKEYGVWVDIFPLDNYKSSKLTHIRKKLNLYKYSVSCAINFQLSPHGKFFSFVKRIFFKIYNKQNPRKYALKLEKLAQKFNNKQTNKIYIIISMYGSREIFDREWFRDTIELEFEGKKYSAPIDYDKILTHTYGDYMTPPPEDKRHWHETEMYLKEQI